MPSLIPDIKSAWKYPSVNLVAAALAIQGALTADDQFVHAASPAVQHAAHIVTLICTVIVGYDRLTAHPMPPTAQPPEPEETRPEASVRLSMDPPSPFPLPRPPENAA